MKKHALLEKRKNKKVKTFGGNFLDALFMATTTDS